MKELAGRAEAGTCCSQVDFLRAEWQLSLSENPAGGRGSDSGEHGSGERGEKTDLIAIWLNLMTE